MEEPSPYKKTKYSKSFPLVPTKDTNDGKGSNFIKKPSPYKRVVRSQIVKQQIGLIDDIHNHKIDELSDEEYDEMTPR